MSSKSHRVEGRPYKRNKERLKRRSKERSEVCWLCGKPIDYSLHYLNPMSFAVDHVVPVSLGGNENDINNMRPTHSVCNKQRGNGTRKKRRSGITNPSEDW